MEDQRQRARNTDYLHKWIQSAWQWWLPSFCPKSAPRLRSARSCHDMRANASRAELGFVADISGEIQCVRKGVQRKMRIT